MAAPAIACEGLTKRFRKGFRTFTAVADLGLEVPRGVTFGLLGPNGAGKTTSIGMVLGLIRPSAGRSTVLGGAIADPAIRRRIGFVPEKFQLPPFLTAEEFLRLHGQLLGLSGADLAGRVATRLERVGLDARRGDRVSGFSKGMQQRLVLAQALLGDPELLVLDEPTSALDPVGRREVRDIVREARARGATVLLNSHLLAEVEAVADSVAILRDGRLVWQGAIASLAGPALRVEARVGGWSAALAAAVSPLVDNLDVGAVPDAHGAYPVAFVVAEPGRVPGVAAAIIDAGGALHALTPQAESLEDAFMRLVGLAQRPRLNAHERADPRGARDGGSGGAGPEGAA